MLDINSVKKRIKEFAEQNHFVQQKDIEIIETSDFNRDNYKKIDGKLFISINEYKHKTEIAFGKINIEIDTIDEDEWYSIDKKNYFVVDISKFPNEDTLIDEIITKCNYFYQELS